MKLLEQEIKWFLRKYGIRIKKYLGQNFLIDEEVLLKIIESAGLCSDDFVLEIGAGPGILTKEISKRVRKVIAIELDRDLIKILEENLKECKNVDIIKEDVLKFDLTSLFQKSKPVKIIANLPYYITTPIIMHLLNQKFPPSTIMVIMVQREVALRIVGSPGSKDYGILSVILQYYTEPELISIVLKKAFIPSPKVDSAILRLKIRKNPPVKVRDENLFFRVVKASFSHRRKTIANSLLKSQLGLDRERIAKLLTDAKIDPMCRAETLSLENFARLANKFIERGKYESSDYGRRFWYETSSTHLHNSKTFSSNVE